MAQLGRFSKVVINSLGVPTASASVEIRKRGATVNGAQSAPTTITVNHPGNFAVNDTFVVGASGATTRTCNAVTATTVASAVTVGDVADDDRLTITNNLPTIYVDGFSGETTANPLTSGSTGLAECWLAPGFYDVLISGASLTATLYSDVFIADASNPRIDVRSFGATGDGTTDDATAINAAIDSALLSFSSATGGEVVVPKGTFLVNSQIVVDPRVRLVGVGGRQSVIKAGASFSGTYVVRLGDGTGTRIFNTSLENLRINCNDVAGVGGVYSTEANEGCVISGCLIDTFVTTGVLYEASGAMQPGNVVIRDTEVTGSASNSTAGINFNNVDGQSLISHVTMNSNSGGVCTDAIALTSCQVMIQSAHFERCTDGIQFNAGSSGAVMVAGGASGVTNVVHIAAGSGGVACTNIVPNSATNAILDDLTSRTITTSSIIGFYLLGADGATTSKACISSSNIAHGYWKLAGALAYRSFQSFTTLDATPSVSTGNFFKTANAGPTVITDFDDGYNGQEITVVIGDANTTIDFSATDLKGNAGSDWVPTSGDHMVCIHDGTSWFCNISDNTA